MIGPLIDDCLTEHQSTAIKHVGEWRNKGLIYDSLCILDTTEYEAQRSLEYM